MLQIQEAEEKSDQDGPKPNDAIIPNQFMDSKPSTVSQEPTVIPPQTESKQVISLFFSYTKYVYARFA